MDPCNRDEKQTLTDPTKLAHYRFQKRNEFEDVLENFPRNFSVWIEYAEWEESHKDFKRARWVWERALGVDYKNHTLWLKYAEMEIKNKFFSHARHVYSRAVMELPRVYQLWYKYIDMEEEMLGDVAGARQVFKMWINRSGSHHQPWLSYITFELRHNEVERARDIFEMFVQRYQSVGVWIQYAKFEMKNGDVARERHVYMRAMQKLADDEEADKLFVAFANFEERCQEIQRARCLYKFALDRIPKGTRSDDLYNKFMSFEKKYGDKLGIEGQYPAQTGSEAS